MRYLLIILCLSLASCAGIQSRYHRVEGGETWGEIAAHYKVPVEQLQKYNSSLLTRGLKPGAKLYIPFEESPTWDAQYSERDRSMASLPPSSDFSKAYFSWPLKGYVSSGFGRRKGKDHEGIDIPARKGTPVRAARSGHVIYAGNKIKGYGNLIVIRHADTYSSVYAHLSKIGVKRSQFVSRGQVIGLVGRTGHATSPHLHFEIRDQHTAVNPLLYLQAQYATNILGR